MTEHLIIGVQPEYKIQETPFQINKRIASTSESFQNKAPGTGVENNSASPLLIPDTYLSAAPVSSNYNPLEGKIYLPQVHGSGTGIQGPNDGPTHLINKAELVEAAYGAVTINEVNRMLKTENYSGAEKLLGRELSIDEIRNQQLGAPDRYIQAKAGLPTQFPSQAKVPLAPNPANPAPLTAEVLANPIGDQPLTFDAAYNRNRYAGVTVTGDTAEREREFVKQLDSKVEELEKVYKANKNSITDAQEHHLKTIIERDKQYAHQRRAGLQGGGIAFGRFTVHPEKLANGELSMKYTHNGKKITDLPNRKLHPALQQAVHDIVHGQPTSGTGLSDADVQYLHKITHRAQVGGDIKAGIPLPPGQRNRARMMVILGEMQAGNDNPELKTELAKLLKLLSTTKAVSRSEAQLIRRTFLS